MDCTFKIACRRVPAYQDLDELEWYLNEEWLTKVQEAIWFYWVIVGQYMKVKKSPMGN